MRADAADTDAAPSPPFCATEQAYLLSLSPGVVPYSPDALIAIAIAIAITPTH
jgi:hypothetical protein